MEFGAAFPADGEVFELVEEGEGLLDDVAEHPHVVQDTQREAMSHMDRLLRKRRPGRQ